MAKKHWSASLRLVHACELAMAWAREQPSYAAAWRTCARGDWMLWLLTRTPGAAARFRPLTVTACECIRDDVGNIPFATRYIPFATRYFITPAGEPETEDIGDLCEAALQMVEAFAHGALPPQAILELREIPGLLGVPHMDMVLGGRDVDDFLENVFTVARHDPARAADIVRAHFPTPPRLPTQRSR